MIGSIVLAAALSGAAPGPVAVPAARTRYHCAYAPGGVLSKVILDIDPSSGAVRPRGLHLRRGEVIRNVHLVTEGPLIEALYDVRRGRRLVRRESHRIDTRTGVASGWVNLFDENGGYIRGGPAPVEGVCEVR